MALPHRRADAGWSVRWVLLASGLAARALASTEAPVPAPPAETIAVVTTTLVRGFEGVSPAGPPLQHRVTATPPDGVDVSALPAGSWLFGQAPVTKTESLAFAVSADRTAFCFDRDADRVLEATELGASPSAQGPARWFLVEGTVRQDVSGQRHEAVIPMAVGVSTAGDASFSRLDGHRRASLPLASRTVALAVLDRTFRGWFSHLGRDELLVDVDGDGSFDVSEDSNERFRLGQPFPVGDVDCLVTAVGPLGTTLTLSRSPKPARRLPSLAVGAPAPDVSAVALDGKPVTLASARGKWVYLDFWATWCGPCRQEIPHLKELRRARPDLVVLGVSGDRDRATLERFVAAQGVDWPQVHDADGTVSAAYRIKSLPRSYLIGPDGRIAAKDLRGPLLPALVGEAIARAGATTARP